MNIIENVDLANHSTMRLGGKASYSCTVTSKDELVRALDWATERQLPSRVIGSGSNIIWRDEGFNGLLIINQILGYEVADIDNAASKVTVGAGENWDEFVERTVIAGLSGVEAMSLIPGTCGATPIQNVGAYGQDVSQTLESVEAYDTVSSEFIVLSNADCDFSYRSSRFKNTEPGRFIIVSLVFKLTKTTPQPPFYPPVADYLQEHQLEPSIENIRQAVVAIRTSKLPDPGAIGNTGSFFANPIISHEQFNDLHSQYTDMRFWETDNGVKISGAWLIENAGYKDFTDPETGMATWQSQPLVLVNNDAPNTAALLSFKQKIVSAVQQKFGVTLEQEPQLLP